MKFIMTGVRSFCARIVMAAKGRKKTSQEDSLAAIKAIEQLWQACQRLSQKADGLKKRCPDLVRRIRKNAEKIKNIEPDLSVQAGKIEQSMVQKITCVSSSCDSVLSGGDVKILSDQLSELEQLLKQRQVIK